MVCFLTIITDFLGDEAATSRLIETEPIPTIDTFFFFPFYLYSHSLSALQERLARVRMDVARGCLDEGIERKLGIFRRSRPSSLVVFIGDGTDPSQE